MRVYIATAQTSNCGASAPRSARRCNRGPQSVNADPGTVIIGRAEIAQGLPLDVAEKTSEKSGSRYYSVNAGALGTIVIYPPVDDSKPVRAFLYPREQKPQRSLDRPASPTSAERRAADVTQLPLDRTRRPGAKPFYNDPLPAS